MISIQVIKFQYAMTAFYNCGNVLLTYQDQMM